MLGLIEKYCEPSSAIDKNKDFIEELVIAYGFILLTILGNLAASFHSAKPAINLIQTENYLQIRHLEWCIY